MEITRRIVFHSGHMLKDDDSKCYEPHGHEYVLECTIAGAVKKEGAETGMVMNFGSLKEIMMTEIHDKLDHKFILDKADPRWSDFIAAVGFDGTVSVDFAPTAENLIAMMYKIILDKLPQGIIISKIKLQETLNCWAEIDNQVQS